MTKKNNNKSNTIVSTTDNINKPILSIDADVLKAIPAAHDAVNKEISKLNKLTENTKKSTLDAQTKRVRDAIRTLNKAYAARDIEAWRIAAQTDARDFWARFIASPTITAYALKWSKDEDAFVLVQNQRMIPYSDVDTKGEFVANRAFYSALAYCNGAVLRFIGGADDVKLNISDKKADATHYSAVSISEGNKVSSSIPEDDRALPWVKSTPNKGDIKTLINRTLTYLLPEGFCKPLRDSDIREICSRMVKYDRNLAASVEQRKPLYSVELLKAVVYAVNHRVNDLPYEITVK